MAKFKKYEIGSDLGLSIDVDKYIAVDHSCRIIERLVNELDLSFIESNYSKYGRSGFPPKLMLSVIFWGYTVGVRSGRMLEKACEENIVFIYLSKGYKPGKTCINDFRNNNYIHFDNLFIQLLEKCKESGLSDTGVSIVDGTILEANSSKKRTKNKGQYEKWRECLLADIDDLKEEYSRNQDIDLKKN